MSISTEASEGTPSGGIRRRICSKIVNLDRRYHPHRASNRKPRINPRIVPITNTLKVRLDSIFVVRSDISRLTADDNKNIAKFMNNDSGEPRSRILSSDSESS